MNWVDGRAGWVYNNRMPTGLSERIETLRSIPFFRGLSDSVLRRLAEESRCRCFPAGQVIFYQAEPGSTCHIVVRGRVRVLLVGEDGRELAVSILGPGQVIGEMALLEDLPRSASVEALEETLTLELHRDVLFYALRTSPALALSLLRELSAKLRVLTEEAEGLASLTVSERLMRRLQKLAAYSGIPVSGGVRIAPPMTQQELAALIGTSRESVNRALVRLRQQGKLRLEGGWIVLLNSESETPSS